MKRVNKANGRITTTDFRSARFGIFRHQLQRIPWETTLERRGIQESVHFLELPFGSFSRIALSKLKTGPFPHAGNQAKTGGAPDKTQTQKGSKCEVEVGTSELGGIQKHYLKCKDGFKKAKACQELNMAKDVKGFYRSINSRRPRKMWVQC